MKDIARHIPPPPNEGDISNWVPTVPRESISQDPFPQEAVLYRRGVPQSSSLPASFLRDRGPFSHVAQAPAAPSYGTTS